MLNSSSISAVFRCWTVMKTVCMCVRERVRSICRSLMFERDDCYETDFFSIQQQNEKNKTLCSGQHRKEIKWKQEIYIIPKSFVSFFIFVEKGLSVEWFSMLWNASINFPLRASFLSYQLNVRLQCILQLSWWKNTFTLLVAFSHWIHFSLAWPVEI